MTAGAASRSRGRRTSSPNPRFLQQLREFGKTVTDDPRLQGCGRWSNVGDADEIRRRRFSCSRPWLCAVCGYRAYCELVEELTNAFTRWTRQGGSLALLTLTQSHTLRDELLKQWNRMKPGWDAGVGPGWRADQKSFGVRGYVRVTEIVHHPESGWNPHLHVPLLLQEDLDDQLYDLRGRFAPRFIEGIKDAGGQALLRGQHIGPWERGTERRLAEYCAKGTTVWRSTEGSRTPMAMLADLKETGEGHREWNEFSTQLW